MLVLVLGGVRSGKSAVAERLAAAAAARVVYLACGQAGDAEMAARITRHREHRDPAWLTVEEPLAIPAAVRRLGKPGACLLLDGLGTWISNLVLAEETAAGIDRQVADLLAAIRETGSAAVIVSDEAGLGLVPPNRLGRLFQDALGLANQQVAAAAGQCLLAVAGLVLDLKALATRPGTGVK